MNEPREPREPEAPREPRDRVLYALIAAGSLLAVWVVSFIVMNSSNVRVSFVLGSARAPLVAIMLVCVALGVVLGLASERLIRRRARSAKHASGDAGAPSQDDLAKRF